MSTGPANPDPAARAARASDADREAAVDVLRQGCAEGRLSFEELAERAERAYAATTHGELAVLTGDLPATRVVGPPALRRANRWVVAVLGSTARRGRWRPDEETTALAVLGSAELDLREAEVAGGGVEVTALALLGSVEITVPEGVDVELSGFALLGSKEARVADVPRRPGTPVVRVRAFAVLGSVEVRTKRRRQLR